MLELEKTYLAKYLPEGLKDCPSKEIIDLYIPASAEHPTVRVRKHGDRFEITKKEPVKDGDASCQREQTICLTEKEFDELSKLNGKKTRKIRHEFKHKGLIAEFDVFQGDLKGLVIVDFEFENVEDKDAFKMPEFCLADITQEEFCAGGMICGKKYEDLEPVLRKYDYIKLFLN